MILCEGRLLVSPDSLIPRTADLIAQVEGTTVPMTVLLCEQVLYRISSLFDVGMKALSNISCVCM